MTEDAHHHEPIVDFKRMYCTVCLFLQWKLFEIRNEKRCDGAFFHMHHKPSGEDPEKGSHEPSKRDPKILLWTP